MPVFVITPLHFLMSGWIIPGMFISVLYEARQATAYWAPDVHVFLSVDKFCLFHVFYVLSLICARACLSQEQGWAEGAGGCSTAGSPWQDSRNVEAEQGFSSVCSACQGICKLHIRIISCGVFFFFPQSESFLWRAFPLFEQILQWSL